MEKIFIAALAFISIGVFSFWRNKTAKLFNFFLFWFFGFFVLLSFDLFFLQQVPSTPKKPSDHPSPPENEKPVIFISAVPCKPLKYNGLHKQIKGEKHKKTKKPE